MSNPGTYQALNRLLTILHRSLPTYLTFASPWTRRGDEPASETLRHIVDDQQQLAMRVAQYIIDHYGRVELGDYPLDFPDTHDLAFDYLIGKLVTCQKSDVAALEQCAAELREDREAAALADEALGSARAHLETLEELAGEVAKQGVSWGKS
jgi:hypothetical protein